MKVAGVSLLVLILFHIEIRSSALNIHNKTERWNWRPRQPRPTPARERDASKIRIPSEKESEKGVSKSSKHPTRKPMIHFKPNVPSSGKAGSRNPTYEFKAAVNKSAPSPPIVITRTKVFRKQNLTVGIVLPHMLFLKRKYQKEIRSGVYNVKKKVFKNGLLKHINFELKNVIESYMAASSSPKSKQI